MVLVPMILALTMHEYAHALAASRLGDHTAKEQGRMTLSPLSHIDPIGTVLLPVMLMAMGSPIFFGWAKPVPYDPRRFRSGVKMRTGAMIVAAAGPFANLIAALLCTVLLGLSYRFGLVGTAAGPFGDLAVKLIGINVGLMVFNLIPIPPLDGSKVLSGLLSARSAVAYEQLMARGGFMLLMVLIAFGGPILRYPMMAVHRVLLNVVLPFSAGASL